MRTALFSSTTIRTGLGIFALGGVCVTLLIGCGGGGPAVPPTVAVPVTYVTSTSSATPTAALPAATLVRFLIQGDGTSIAGTTPIFTQDSLGAMTVIGNNNSLLPISGQYAVQEFMGDTMFAQGRWTKGNATVNGVALSPLTGTDSIAVHYLVTRDLPSFTAGTYTCGRDKTDLRSTGLTYSGGAVPNNTMLVGAFVPTQTTITVANNVATVNFTNITVVAGNGPFEYDYQNTSVPFSNPTDMPQYKDYYNSNGGEGIAIVLGQDANPLNITLGIALRRSMSDGTRYQGMASIICRPNP